MTCTAPVKFTHDEQTTLSRGIEHTRVAAVSLDRCCFTDEVENKRESFRVCVYVWFSDKLLFACVLNRGFSDEIKTLRNTHTRALTTWR